MSLPTSEKAGAGVPGSDKKPKRATDKENASKGKGKGKPKGTARSVGEASGDVEASTASSAGQGVQHASVATLVAPKKPGAWKRWPPPVIMLLLLLGFLLKAINRASTNETCTANAVLLPVCYVSFVHLWQPCTLSRVVYRLFLLRRFFFSPCLSVPPSPLDPMTARSTASEGRTGPSHQSSMSMSGTEAAHAAASSSLKAAPGAGASTALVASQGTPALASVVDDEEEVEGEGDDYGSDSDKGGASGGAYGDDFEADEVRSGRTLCCSYSTGQPWLPCAAMWLCFSLCRCFALHVLLFCMLLLPCSAVSLCFSALLHRAVPLFFVLYDGCGPQCCLCRFTHARSTAKLRCFRSGERG